MCTRTRRPLLNVRRLNGANDWVGAGAGVGDWTDAGAGDGSDWVVAGAGAGASANRSHSPAPVLKNGIVVSVIGPAAIVDRCCCCPDTR